MQKIKSSIIIVAAILLLVVSTFPVSASSYETGASQGDVDQLAGLLNGFIGIIHQYFPNLSIGEVTVKGKNEGEDFSVRLTVQGSNETSAPNATNLTQVMATNATLTDNDSTQSTDRVGDAKTKSADDSEGYNEGFLDSGVTPPITSEESKDITERAETVRPFIQDVEVVDSYYEIELALLGNAPYTVKDGTRIAYYKPEKCGKSIPIKIVLFQGEKIITGRLDSFWTFRNETGRIHFPKGHGVPDTVKIFVGNSVVAEKNISWQNADADGSFTIESVWAPTETSLSFVIGDNGFGHCREAASPYYAIVYNGKGENKIFVRQTYLFDVKFNGDGFYYTPMFSVPPGISQGTMELHNKNGNLIASKNFDV